MMHSQHRTNLGVTFPEFILLAVLVDALDGELVDQIFPASHEELAEMPGPVWALFRRAMDQGYLYSEEYPEGAALNDTASSLKDRISQICGQAVALDEALREMDTRLVRRTAEPAADEAFDDLLKDFEKKFGAGTVH